MTNFQKFIRELKRQCQLNLWRPFLLAEVISFSGKRFFELKLYPFQPKPFLLVEAIPFSGSYSFQWKPFHFSGSHVFQWKPFFSLEAVSFNGSRFFQWKPLFLIKTESFNGSHSLWFKHFPYCKHDCNGNYSIQWKLFLLVETWFQ